MPSHIISSDFTPTHVVSVKLFEFLFLLDQSCLQSNQQVLLYPITSCIISITACVLLHQNTVAEDCTGAAFCAAPSGSVWAWIPQRSVASIHPDRLWPAWMPSSCRKAFQMLRPESMGMLFAIILRCYLLWEIITIEGHGTGHWLGFCVCL